MMSRTPRELDTREHKERPKRSFVPSSVLPTPHERPGVKHRWVRVSALGEADIKNVSGRFREGWVPVKRDDYPELEVVESDKDSRFPDGVEIGGLLLCSNSEDTVDSRREYYAERARTQMESVDNTYLRENDPRMPMLKPERRTRTTFGSSE